MGDEARWPDDWAERVAGVDCEMCADQGKPDNGYGLRFLDGDFADAYLQRVEFPAGYTVVVWKHGHVAEPTQLTSEQAAGYWSDVVAAAAALERHYRPAKMNYQTLGNAVPHLHTHLFPRYLDDPAPGAPLPFDLVRRGVADEAAYLADVEALRTP